MKGNHLVVETDDYINLDYSLDCGQSFRWKKSENIWQAVAFGKKISIEQKDENTLFFYDTTEDDFEKIWKIYFLHGLLQSQLHIEAFTIKKALKIV